MKYFTKSGHRSLVADVMTYLVAAKLNDCSHKVVPSFFIGFFRLCGRKKSRDLICIRLVIHYVTISKLISLTTFYRFMS